MDVESFKKNPLIGIARGIAETDIEPLLEAAINAGLGAFEVTMNTPAAEKIIRKARKVSRGKIAIGAGTVINGRSLKKAIAAGATFIVMPVMVADIARYCRRNSVPFFPGAFTPQEIYNAWQAKAAMVKVFPAGLLGPGYFKEIKGPFNDIKLLACGGVTSGNIKDFFSCGASAAAFGAGIFRKEWIEAGDFSRIESEIRKLISAMH